MARRSQQTDYVGLLRILDSNPDGLVIVSMEGTCLYANQTAGELYGTRPESLIGAKLGLPIEADGERAITSCPNGRQVELNPRATVRCGLRASSAALATPSIAR